VTDRFAHHLRLDQIRGGERIYLVADDAERSDVAERLGLRALGRLEAHVTLSRSGPRVRAEGRIAATLDQSCVITGELVAAHFDQPFTLLFMPGFEVGSPDEEIELGEEDCDTVFYDGAAIDL